MMPYNWKKQYRRNLFDNFIAFPALYNNEIRIKRRYHLLEISNIGFDHFYWMDLVNMYNKEKIFFNGQTKRVNKFVYVYKDD